MDFSKLDIFPKLDNEYRVGTKIGGLLSFLSIFAIIALSFSEFKTYKNPPIRQRLLVDTSRPVGPDGVTISMETLPQLEIYLNITFPQVPCYLLHFDALDQLTQSSLPIKDAKKNVYRIKNNSIIQGFDIEHFISLKAKREEGYCGSCYAPNITDKCCNTCKEVIDVLAEREIKNITLNDIEQCNFFIDQFSQMEGEGCRFEVDFHVPKTDSEFHVCPGIPTINRFYQHFHNIELLGKKYSELNLTHTINKLHFSKSATTSLLDGYTLTQEEKGIFGVIYKADVLQDSYSVSRYYKYSPTTFPVGVSFVYGISPINAVKYVDKEPFTHLLSRFVTVIGGVLCLFKVLDYLFFSTHKNKKEENIPIPSK